ncbi:MAG: PilT/PilU family type 4a pilus ATPase [Eubacterium sp.]
MELMDYLEDSVRRKASDIFIITNFPCSYRIEGQIVRGEGEVFTPKDTEKLIREIYDLTTQRDMENLLNGDDDFSFSLKGIGRFRANVYRQRGTLAAVIRVVSFELPDPSVLSIPQTVLELSKKKNGLILVTGPAGSGKSTTLACIIDKINKEKNGHIVTMEDPIEYLHRHNKCIVTQREIPHDSLTYVTALKAVLRQSPDVILLGELRGVDTMEIAMTAAETGQLIFSTLHTTGAANTIDRVIDVFPVNQQHQIRTQLSMVLQAVVSQQLVPTVDGRLTPAFEIMLVTPAIRNMIRDAKVHQIDSAIFSGAREGMCTMDSSLLELYKAGKITEQTALMYSQNHDSLAQKIKGNK